MSKEKSKIKYKFNIKAFTRDILIIVVSVAISILLIGLGNLANSMYDSLGTFVPYTIGFSLLTIGFMPIGVIIASTVGSKRVGLIVFCIISIYGIFQGNLPWFICLLITTLVCGTLKEKFKGPFIVRAIINTIVVSTISIYAMLIYHFSGAMTYFMMSIVIVAIPMILISCIAAELVAKIPLFKRAQTKERALEKNYRRASVNRKIMLMINVSCVILILVFSLFAYNILKNTIITDTITVDNNLQVMIADEFGEYIDDEELSEESINGFGDVLQHKIDDYSINVPARIYIIKNDKNIGYYVVDFNQDYMLEELYTVNWISETNDNVEIRYATPTSEDSNYMVVVVSHADLSERQKNMVMQFIGITIYLVILINLISQFLVHYSIVKPINALTSVAVNFAYDNHDDMRVSQNDIKKLDINTGDEIESLYKAFSETMSDMSDYIQEVKDYADKISLMQHNVIITMADIIESRDENTGGHVKRTAVYVELIAKKLREKGLYNDVLTDRYIENMIVAAPLHDMGKIHVPDAILNKNGRLTDDEFTVMKTHTTAGKELLEHASSQLGTFEYLDVALKMAGSHHEWWNGNGYPEKIAGEDIPLCARIMAVADVFDALVSKRCYKEGMPLDKALGIIKEESGSHFDPDVAAAFLECVEEVKVVMEEM